MSTRRERDNWITVHVWKENPVWDTVEKWWMLPKDMVRELYIEAWEVDGDSVVDFDSYIRSQHKEAVVLTY